jgi:hypothetical protein
MGIIAYEVQAAFNIADRVPSSGSGNVLNNSSN